MLPEIIRGIKAKTKIQEVNAHCDIPCKIYDPITAQIAALSVVRLMDIMEETAKSDGNNLIQQNTISRCIFRKEEEAEKVKHEIRIIWGDYFKAPQFESHPDAHEIAHQIMLKSSACKQGADRTDAEQLLNLVNKFAEIFWTTKNIKSERKVCPYPPELPVVYPSL